MRNLRDWAVGQRILADADLQQFKNRHDAIYPLTFSGNVQTMGGGRQGLHVHVPETPPVSRQLPRLHITGTTTGAGKYLARIVTPPAGTLSSTSDLTSGQVGTDGNTDVAAWNQQEIGTTGGTHWLTHADNTNQKYFEAVAVLGTDEAGRTVYAFNGFWLDPCS